MGRLSLSFERRLFLSVLFAGLPGVGLALFLLWSGQYSLYHKTLGTVVLALLWSLLAVSACGSVTSALRVLSNVIESLKEEDFSFRAAHAIKGDALGDLAIEVNKLAQALNEERLASLETVNLFRRIMSEAGAVMFAFSDDRCVRLMNRDAARLLGHSEEQLLHRSAQELGITDLIEGPPAETITRMFGGLERRWIVRRSHFRFHGIQHTLIVMSEASEALRAEERSAWQKLIRVLGHEINNSLAPIKSIAYTLARTSASENLPAPLKVNLKQGLEVIADRSDSLNRFLQAYTQIAKLPPPSPMVSSLPAIVSNVVALEHRLPIATLSDGCLDVLVDRDQLEHAIINLVRNAVEAVLMNSEVVQDDAVTISWHSHAGDLELWIRDRGIGLPETQNLFVPFYTTKQNGTGIGLVLSRQIIEAHNGRLSIQNRQDGPGCEVRLFLPRCVVARKPLGRMPSTGK